MYSTVVWTTVSLVVAIVGGIVLYHALCRDNDAPTDERVVALKNFINFKTLIIEPLLKCLYCIVAIFITLFSFNYIGQSFLGFLIMLVVGNVVVRIAYEGSMIVLMIWRNTSDINKKLGTCDCNDKCDCDCKKDKKPVQEAKSEEKTNNESETVCDENGCYLKPKISDCPVISEPVKETEIPEFVEKPKKNRKKKETIETKTKETKEKPAE